MKWLAASGIALVLSGCAADSHCGKPSSHAIKPVNVGILFSKDDDSIERFRFGEPSIDVSPRDLPILVNEIGADRPLQIYVSDFKYLMIAKRTLQDAGFRNVIVLAPAEE